MDFSMFRISIGDQISGQKVKLVSFKHCLTSLNLH